ncbi:MAG: helix-turn-helix transcriptional regulator [Candidatus Paceibacterota bacterium]
MARDKLKITGRKFRSITPEKQAEYDEVRRQAKAEFPPAENLKPPLPRTGVAAQIRRARKAQGLTWYAVAKQAGIPNSNTVRDIEQGLDAKLSNVEAIANVLGLKLEAVEA